MRKSFPCTQCGICCQRVHLASETRYLDRGDGVCKHYDAEHKICGIYESRPDICRVDTQYDLHYASQCTWNRFVELNLAVCVSLQKQAADTPVGWEK